jgi:hypothetical protein
MSTACHGQETVAKFSPADKQISQQQIAQPIASNCYVKTLQKRPVRELLLTSSVGMPDYVRSNLLAWGMTGPGKRHVFH